MQAVVPGVPRAPVQGPPPGPVARRQVEQLDVPVAVGGDVVPQQGEVVRVRLERQDIARRPDHGGQEEGVVADVGPEVDGHVPRADLVRHHLGGPRLEAPGVEEAGGDEPVPGRRVEGHPVAEDGRHRAPARDRRQGTRDRGGVHGRTPAM